MRSKGGQSLMKYAFIVMIYFLKKYQEYDLFDSPFFVNQALFYVNYIKILIKHENFRVALSKLNLCSLHRVPFTY